MTTTEHPATHTPATQTAAGLTELVAALYRETLRDDTLDADSDFYEAGGDSLVAFQITARLRDALGSEIPVALVFAYPSPTELAEVVADDLAAASA